MTLFTGDRMATKRLEQTDRTAKENGVHETARSPFTLGDVKTLVATLAGTDVTSLVWDRGGERIAIQRGQQAVVTQVAHHAVAPAPAAVPALAPVPVPVAGAAPAPVAAAKTETKPGVIVTSPFVGTFYRAPSPESPTFVELGTVVKKGQVLCIVEAMKLMNEIEAEIPGRIVKILVENGHPVEFNQPLFLVEKI